MSEHNGYPPGMVKTESDVCFYAVCTGKPDYVIWHPDIDDYYYTCTAHSIEVVQLWEQSYSDCNYTVISSYTPYWRSHESNA